MFVLVTTIKAWLKCISSLFAFIKLTITLGDKRTEKISPSLIINIIFYSPQLRVARTMDTSLSLQIHFIQIIYFQGQ